MDNPSRTDIGQRIRQQRILNDYTQQEFAEAIDISINFLSEIENGKKGLSQNTLYKICKMLGISADYILFGETAPKASLIELANALSDEDLDLTIQYLQSLAAMRKII